MPYANPENRRAYHRKRYATDPVYRAKVLERGKKRDRVKVNAYRREWRKRTYVKIKERGAFSLYRAAHRGYFSELSSRRRAQTRNTQAEAVDYGIILRESCGTCGICGERLLDSFIDIDHIIPLARNGTHTYDNLQATHSSCNRRKNTKLMSELMTGRR